MSGNAKQRRKRDRARAGYAKCWSRVVDRRAVRETLRTARELGIPWREFAAEVAAIKQRIADDIERALSDAMPLKVPQDVPRVEQLIGKALRRAVARGDLAIVDEAITIESWSIV